MTLITVTLFGSAVQAQTDENERKAVLVPVENYFKAHATQNSEYLYKAFHPETRLMFVRDGKYTVWTFEEYVPKMSSGKPAADETERKRRVENIDLTGNAGMVKVVLDYPQVVFTDYLSLLKINDEWKIVGKISYTVLKPKKP